MAQTAEKHTLLGKIVYANQYADIATAIAALPATGGIVMIPEGIYTLAAKLVVPSNVTLQGEGWKSIIKSANNLNDTLISCTATDNVIIRDLAIDMNRANNTTIANKQALFLNTASNSVVDNVYVHDMRFEGSQGNSAVAFTNTTNCIFRNSFISTVGDYGFVSNGMQQCKVISNYVHNASGHGIAVCNGGIGTAYERASRNIITGNTIYFDSSAASDTDGIKITICDYSVFANNTIYHTTRGYHGIFETDAGDDHSTNSNYCVKNVYSNNVIYNFRRGIWLAGQLGATINGNTVYITDYASALGISIDKEVHNDVPVDSIRCVINDNYIEQATNTTDTASVGIWLPTTQSFNTIKGNIIHNFSAQGIVLGTTDNYASYNIVTNNLILNSNKDGFDLTGKYNIITNNTFRGSSRLTNDTYIDLYLSQTSTYNVINDNIIICDAANKSRYGIYENAATSDYNTYIGNNISGVVRDKMTIKGVNDEISHNIGYVTESSGTIAVANGKTAGTVTHGLAFTPTADNIMLTPINTMGSATTYYTNGYGTTTFVINVNTDPGTVTAGFAWKAGL